MNGLVRLEAAQADREGIRLSGRAVDVPQPGAGLIEGRARQNPLVIPDLDTVLARRRLGDRPRDVQRPTPIRAGVKVVEGRRIAVRAVLVADVQCLVGREPGRLEAQAAADCGNLPWRRECQATRMQVGGDGVATGRASCGQLIVTRRHGDAHA